VSRVVNRVVVMGGGTSGWMSAAYLERLLTRMNVPDASVTLVESEDIGIIGVGEATLNDLKRTLRFLEIDEREFMIRTHATFKNGIKFVNWREDPAKIGRHHYYHPFEAVPKIDGMWLVDVWSCLKADNEIDLDYGYMTGPSAFISDRLRSPKTADSKPYEGLLDYAYHTDTVLFGRYLREVAMARGVKRIVDNVVGVKSDERGFLTALETKEHGAIEGDLFIDCSGFGGYLINKHYGVDFVSFNDALFNDRAVALRVPYRSADAPINPFTTATAMSSGWIWDIPLSDQRVELGHQQRWSDDSAHGRRGTGYVYSSQFISDDDAERELRAYVGAEAEGLNARRLNMRIGHNRKFWVKNCVAIGLAGGFIEPLESTGIGLISQGLALLAFHFPTRDFPEPLAESYNGGMTRLYEHIRDFIVLHYCTTQREDTEFWRANKHHAHLPPRLESLLEQWRYRAPDAYDNLSGFDFFHPTSFQYILAGMGHLAPPSDYVRNRLPREYKAHMRRRIAEVHASALAVSIGHIEFLRTQYGGAERSRA
jgi:tryptophan halogenase